MDFVLRLALLYFGLFGAIGIQLPFLPVWLAAKGLDEAAIGLVLATATGFRVATVPFATRAADLFGSLKWAILIATIGCALSLTALGLFGSTVATILLCYVLASACSGTALPLTEAYALRGLSERKRSYGPVRLWGSAAFILGALATGLITAWIARVHIIWVLVLTYWLAALAAAALVPVSVPQGDGKRAGVGVLLKNPALIAIIIASGCMQASHALFYAFGTLHWSASGISGAGIAGLWSISVGAEIVLFALSGRFPRWLSAPALLAIGSAGAALRWLGMAFDPPGAVLPALQLLHALSFGATHLGAVMFVARAAPPSLTATAQGLLATANGGLMALAMAASGLLHARYGAGGYIAMTLMALAGGVATLLAARWSRRSADALTP